MLITGGAGFVGSSLARRLVADGHHVVLFDSLASALADNRRDLGEGTTVVQGDILDLSHLLRVFKEHAVQRVVHAAAIVGAPASIQRPLYTARVNIEGSLNVFEAARFAGVERVIDISSEEGYGPFQVDPAPEDHPQNPVSPYGVAKVAVERFGEHYSQHYGLQYVAARLSWLYGPGFPRSRMPRSWMEDALADRPTLMSSGAEHRIDFTYVDDAVEGIRLLVEAPDLMHRAYNVGSGHAVTLCEMAAEVKKLLPRWEYEIGPGLLEQMPGYRMPQKGSLGISRISCELGYCPAHSITSGLQADLAGLMRRGERS